MNIERAKKWVQALRSDEFKQGKYTLRDMRDGYCCLGVACEVYRRETGKGQWVLADTSLGKSWKFVIGDDASAVVDGDESSAALPVTVANWLGTGTETNPPLLTPEVGWPNRMRSAAALNDTGGWSFNQIADAIERTLDHEDSVGTPTLVQE